MLSSLSQGLVLVHSLASCTQVPLCVGSDPFWLSPSSECSWKPHSWAYWQVWQVSRYYRGVEGRTASKRHKQLHPSRGFCCEDVSASPGPCDVTGHPSSSQPLFLSAGPSHLLWEAQTNNFCQQLQHTCSSLLIQEFLKGSLLPKKEFWSQLLWRYSYHSITYYCEMYGKLGLLYESLVTSSQKMPYAHLPAFTLSSWKYIDAMTGLRVDHWLQTSFAALGPTQVISSKYQLPSGIWGRGETGLTHLFWVASNHTNNWLRKRDSL